jgi:hypothetical protein
MGGIQHADFGFLVGEYGVNEFCADCLPGRTLRNETILAHPLGEEFAHHWATVVETPWQRERARKCRESDAA